MIRYTLLIIVALLSILAIPETLAVSESQADTSIVWVFLRDKGVEDIDAAIRELEENYNERAISRRRMRRSFPGLFDERDLPVHKPYAGMIKQLSTKLRVSSKWLNAVSVVVTQNQLERIEALPFVTGTQPVQRGKAIEITVERTIDGDGQTDGGFYGLATDQLEWINLPALHNAGFTGQGIIIGVLDTGFKRTHDVFNQEGHELVVVAEYDFVNDDPNTAPEGGDDSSQHNHGTMILGTMGGYLPNTYVGAVYDASFILCKTEDITDEYQAEEDFYVAGLEFIEANGGDVATSSLGYIAWYSQSDLDGETAVTTIGVNIATGNGIHCCTAAGNGGNDQNPNTSHLIAPSDAFEVLTLGAENVFGETTGFSSDGPTADGRVKPEVMAVGRSAATISPSNDSGYVEASGTSLSTPQAAGVVGSLTQAGPNWSVQSMREAILFTARDYVNNGTYDPLFVRGYGTIDAFGAYEAGGPAIAELTNLSVDTGTILNGGLAQIVESDNAYLNTRSGFGVTLVDLHNMQATVSAVTSRIDGAALALTIESRIDQPVGSVRIRLYNWNTGSFENAGQYSIGTTEETVVLDGIDATNYIDGDGIIEMEIRHIVFVPFLAFTFESFIDWIEIAVE